MFKKSLVAVAVLGAAFCSAQAAEVQLYGLVDLGLNWTQTDNDGVKTDSFSMKSGQNSGSRFGFKGTEDLGNGYTVGFVLENGFQADSGSLETGDRLFHRESLLFVQSAWGELSFGRTGGLDAGTGRYNLMGSGASALGTGWDLVGDSRVALLGTGDRMDNTITYKSPDFAGFNVYAQASLKKDSKDKENGNDTKQELVAGQEGSSDADRYYAVAVTYGAGALKTGLIYSQTDYSRFVANSNTQNDDTANVVSAFVNYDFGMVKPMLAVQYWDGGLATGIVDFYKPDSEDHGNDKHFKNFGGLTKGYGVVVGATAPVVGGTLKATVGYNDYESIDDSVNEACDGNNLMVGVGFEYPLSKRTLVYTAAGYNQFEYDFAAGDKEKDKSTEVMFGMVHKF